MSSPTGSRPTESDYVAPRELEHPVLPLQDVDVRTLVWVQPMPMRPAYELWAGEAVVATLRYRGLQRREALACAAEGMWTFDDDPEGAVRIVERSTRCGRFVWEGRRGVLRLEDGAAFVWQRGASEGAQGRSAFYTDDGRALLTFTSELSTQARFRVDVLPEGAEHARLTLLALLGCYHLLATRGLQPRRPVIAPPLSGQTPVHRS